ncbi:MAG: hypothetical protein BroJett030_32290 [Alphaproteobacteria bacterium]|nr:MAG: hypothetical protein BroJett030_32290 [Alphaproteobacteria bacterium]
MTGAIDPGRLRARLEYETLVEMPDGQGGYEASWVKQFDVWAAIRPLAGAAPEEAGTRQAVTTHEIIVRKRAGIVAGARFRLGPRLFDIAAAHDPDETGRYLTCRCRETR